MGQLTVTLSSSSGVTNWIAPERISTIESPPLLRRCLNECGKSVAGDECARGTGGAFESARVDIHQGERAILELRVAEDVTDESQWKDVPTRPNNRDLCQFHPRFRRERPPDLVPGLACFTNSTRG
jgi:hypothetical protein